MKQLKVFLSIKHVPVLLFFFLFLFRPQDVHSQFANGADIGWLSQMESAGYVFYNDSGIQKNCMEILKEKGINALRFRVWVNPAGGWCGKKDVSTMALRAHSLGFKVLIDFHLSDTWADPGHQTIPAGWQKDASDVTALATDVYNHVYDILDTLKSIGVTPVWVQIGNETSDGMLWQTGRASTHMANFATLIKSGYNAAKAIDSSIQVIVQLDNGHDNALYRRIFDGLKTNGAPWDIIGMSVYPRWANLTWQVDDSLALENMKDLVNRYSTKVMVVEAGYYYYQAAAAKAYLTDLIAKVKSIGGLGVFYWEPECYNWQNYSMGAWDPSTKQPTVAMDAFLDTVTTSVKREEIISHYALNVYPNPFNPSATIRYTLADRSQVSLVVYNLLGQKIKTLVDEERNAGEFSIPWLGNDDAGKMVVSGVYFIRMLAGSKSKIQKVVLVK